MWALWRSCPLAQVGAHKGERPQFSFPGESSSLLLSGVWFWGSQCLHTWESSVAGLRPGATYARASFQMPVSAQVRWGFSSSHPTTPLGLGFGFRVQTGLHSSEEAGSRLIKAGEINNNSNSGPWPAVPASATRGASR